MAAGFSAQGGICETFTISEDLSAKQWYVVKNGASAGAVLLADTAGGTVVGVLADTGLDGSSNTENASVVTLGPALCKIGGSVSIGDPLQADTDGMAITATTSDYVFGYAREAGSDGDLIRIIVTHAGIF